MQGSLVKAVECGGPCGVEGWYFGAGNRGLEGSRNIWDVSVRAESSLGSPAGRVVWGRLSERCFQLVGCYNC